VAPLAGIAERPSHEQLGILRARTQRRPQHPALRLPPAMAETVGGQWAISEFDRTAIQ